MAELQTTEDLLGTVAVFKSKRRCRNQGSCHDLGRFLSLERPFENGFLVLSPTCDLWRWLNCPGSEGSVSLPPDSGLGPDVGSSEATPEASGLLPEERACHPAPPSLYPTFTHETGARAAGDPFSVFMAG